MDDNIELPPLPRTGYASYGFETVMNYARDAVLADRERRALWEAQPAKPEVHSATLQLTTKGNLVMNPAIIRRGQFQWSENDPRR